MPVDHIVWLKFREDVPAERIERHVCALAALEHRVPGILRLTIGRNFTDRANGFTHGLVVTLVDRAALPAYLAHPAHVEVAAPLRQDADVLVLDYEY